MYVIEPEQERDGPGIEALHGQVFGPGRFARAAFRVREQASDVAGLSFVARASVSQSPALGESQTDEPDQSPLLGSLRFSWITIGEAEGVLLGPLAVGPANQRLGIGLALMQRSLPEAALFGITRVVLVGDLPLYARVGFERVPPGRLTLPAPVDPARLLWRALQDGAFDGVSGPIHGRRRHFSVGRSTQPFTQHPCSA